MKEFMGEITSDERNVILNLFKKKCSLEELMLVDNIDEVLLRAVKNDLADAEKNYQEWWDRISMKYNWKKVKGKTWTVDFESCKVFLDL